ncbi:marR family protein [Mycobacterium intracellulare 1956]|uniref:MarR family protein n=1 Tax=Mycobacterium intracellulare 1956 TaxID=1299331 RepID=X8CSM1_MYCIT|nr:marR family protein [Mycobacterium intracellulare 1956]
MIRALHPGFMTMMRQLDADLQREHRMSHAEFVALMFLSEASDRTLGLSELARRCQQSLSAISRTVGRLEAQGLVRREQSSQDARAYNAVLTDAGLTRLEQAVPTHVVSLRRHLFDHLNSVDLKTIGDAFERIAAAASGDPHAVPGQPSPDTRWGDTSRPERIAPRRVGITTDAVTWAGSVAGVPATGQRDPHGFPTLSLPPAELGCRRLGLSSGSYS